MSRPLSELLDAMDSILGENGRALAELNVRVSRDVLARLGNSNLKHFHVSLGPLALEMNYDELVESLIENVRRGDEERNTWNALSETEKLRWNIEHLESTLRDIMTRSKSSEESDAAFRSNIWGEIDMALVHLRSTGTYKR